MTEQPTARIKRTIDGKYQVDRWDAEAGHWTFHCFSMTEADAKRVLANVFA